MNEHLHAETIARIAESIAEEYDGRGVRITAISGPSSSGKTTFSLRLCEALQSLGLDPVQISLDDYFIDRELTPRDADGNYDFEALECVDRALLGEQLRTLVAGGSVTVPLYDFVSGHRKWHDEPLHLGPRPIMVMEGLHALNPALIPSIPRGIVFSIFVEPQAVEGIQGADLRLLRRISRDYAHRGHSAAATIGMWGSVRRGEEKNIYPYAAEVDARFHSQLSYEAGVLRTKVEPLLLDIGAESPAYGEAQRLLGLLGTVEPLPVSVVPPESLLSEFVR